MKFEREKFYKGPLTYTDLREAYLASHGYPVALIDNTWTRLVLPSEEVAPKIRFIFITSEKYNSISDIIVLHDRVAHNDLPTAIEEAPKEFKHPRVIVAPVVVRSFKMAMIFAIGHVWIAGIVSLLLHAIFGFWLVWKELHFLFPGTPDITTTQCEAQKP